jgi:phosphonate transport system substrate-binding protein
MSLRYSRRLFLLELLLLTACGVKSISNQGEELTIGLVSFDQGEEAINRYTKFNNYLGEKTGAIVRLEPTFNETQAIERIRSREWSLVFARPGLAAIAIAQNQYLPLFPLRGINNLRSILVVRQGNPIRNLKELQGQTVALGKPGSATGYYFPIYNLYGLTLSEIIFAPTPKTVLELVAQGKATAGALSMEEFNSYSPQFSQTPLRVLYTDPHYVPPGAVLVGPNIERNRQEQIQQFMSNAPSVLVEEAGYVPNGPLPSYEYMIAVVQRVNSIFDDGAAPSQLKPARLFKHK